MQLNNCLAPLFAPQNCQENWQQKNKWTNLGCNLIIYFFILPAFFFFFSFFKLKCYRRICLVSYYTSFYGHFSWLHKVLWKDQTLWENITFKCTHCTKTCRYSLPALLQGSNKWRISLIGKVWYLIHKGNSDHYGKQVKSYYIIICLIKPKIPNFYTWLVELSFDNKV